MKNIFVCRSYFQFEVEISVTFIISKCQHMNSTIQRLKINLPQPSLSKWQSQQRGEWGEKGVSQVRGQQAQGSEAGKNMAFLHGENWVWWRLMGDTAKLSSEATDVLDQIILCGPVLCIVGCLVFYNASSTSTVTTTKNISWHWQLSLF